MLKLTISNFRIQNILLQFGLDSSSGQRILPIEMAVSLWLLVFSQSEPPILKKWLHFLEKHPQVKGYRAFLYIQAHNFKNFRLGEYLETPGICF